VTAGRFDSAYYTRFYGDPATRVSSRASVRTLGRFVCSYLQYLDIEVERALDLGCGLGYWQNVVRRHFPDAEYVGVEVSAHLCKTYGWRRGSVVDYRGTGADLVICQGVLQYLGSQHARLALRNLARLTEGALYLEVLTQEDWERNCNRDTTDGDVHLRPAAWYRRAIARDFVSCGGGLFLPKSSPAVLFELEKLSI
jgi:hypothetical protein